MNADDPKLTGYALDELEASERQEVEALLRESPEAARELEAMAAFAAALGTRLKAEPAPDLSARQRAEIMRIAAGTKPLAAEAAPARKGFGMLALAASVLVGAGVALLLPLLSHGRKQEAVTAKVPAPPHDGSQVRVGLAPEGAPRPQENPLVPGLPQGTYIDMLAKNNEASYGAQLDYMHTDPLEGSSKKVLKRQYLGWTPGTALKFQPGEGGKELAPEEGEEGAGGESGASLASAPEPGAKVNTISSRRSSGWASARRGGVQYSVATAKRPGGAGAPVMTPGAPRVVTPPAQWTWSDASSLGSPLLPTVEVPLSNVPTDRPTSSYAYVRRFLNDQMPPPVDAVRINELINYFDFDTPRPSGDAAVGVAMEVGPCPWAPEHRLVRVGLRARGSSESERVPTSLVFLIDVSGSMQGQNKLPVLKRSLLLMLEKLGERDQVGFVVYGGQSGCVLEPTSSKTKIRAAIAKLEEGGPGKLGVGLPAAFELAAKHRIKRGINRVLLVSDGDWHAGQLDQGDFWSLVEKNAQGGISLSVLGLGLDNVQDDLAARLASRGQGRFLWADNLGEARKALVEELGSTLMLVARDMQAQIEFNPAQVRAYRLLGAEPGMGAGENPADQKDGLQLLSGQNVTLFYEIVPVQKPAVAEPLKYQGGTAGAPPAGQPAAALAAELLTLRVRYFDSLAGKACNFDYPVTDPGHGFSQNSTEFRFGAAVAACGIYLRHRPAPGTANWELVHSLAVDGKGADPNGCREEFVSLVEKARSVVR